MRKKLLGLFLGLWLVLISAGKVLAVEDLTIYLFYSESCPHCKEELVFLNDLDKRYENVDFEKLEVGERENLVLWQKTGERLGLRVGTVPFTVIGEKYLNGYLNDETSGKAIEEAVKQTLEKGVVDLVGEIREEIEKSEVGEVKGVETDKIEDKLVLPVFGELNVKKLSLPIITFLIALLDGFNPCAMWTLLFLISLLLGMKDRKRMWLLGGVFISVSGAVYFMIMAAWLNVFLLVGLVKWIKILIGLFALGAGWYSLRDWWKNKDGSCKITEHEKRQKTFAKLKEITQNQKLFLALGGIGLLAVAVNMVELVCSAGLPAIFTQILTMNKLASWQYYGYLLFYILIFMLDDLIVFIIAMTTLKAIGIDGKYSRWSRLIGGILMTVIGLLMLFKPEWLMFG